MFPPGMGGGDGGGSPAKMHRPPAPASGGLFASGGREEPLVYDDGMSYKPAGSAATPNV